jgi:hypothetical protein
MDKTKKLYDLLVQQGMEMPEYGTFLSDVAKPEKAQKLYNVLAGQGMELPEFGTFHRDLVGGSSPTPDKKKGNSILAYQHLPSSVFNTNGKGITEQVLDATVQNSQRQAAQGTVLRSPSAVEKRRLAEEDLRTRALNDATGFSAFELPAGSGTDNQLTENIRNAHKFQAVEGVMQDHTKLQDFYQRRLKALDEQIAASQQQQYVSYGGYDDVRMEDTEDTRRLRAEKAKLEETVTTMAKHIVVKDLDMSNPEHIKEAGLRLQSVHNPVLADNLRRYEKKGLPVSEVTKMNTEMIGLQAFAEKLASDIETAPDEASKKEAARRLQSVIQQYEELPNKFPEAKKVMLARAIGDQVYNDASVMQKLFLFKNEDKRDRAAEKLGIPKEVVKDIPVDMIPGNDWLTSFVYGGAKNMWAGIAPIYRGIKTGILGEDTDAFDVDQMNKQLAESLMMGETDAQRLVQQDQIAKVDPSSKGLVKMVENPRAGGYNINAFSLLNNAADMTGQIAAMAVGTKGLGAGLKGVGMGTNLATKAGTFGYGMLSSIEDNYMAGKDIIADEKQRWLYAMIQAAKTGATELIMPDAKFVDDLAGIASREAKDFLSRLPKEGLQALQPNTVKEFVKKSLKETLVNTGKETLEEELDAIGSYVTDAIFAPASVEGRSLGKEMLDTAVTTALGTLPLSGMSGVGAASRERRDGRLTREALYQAGKLPSHYSSMVADQLENGALTQEQYNTHIQTINRMAKVVQETEAQGPRLTDNQRRDYAFNRVLELQKQDQLSQLDDPILVEQIQNEIKDLQQQRQTLLDTDADEDTIVNPPDPAAAPAPSGVTADGTIEDSQQPAASTEEATEMEYSTMPLDTFRGLQPGSQVFVETANGVVADEVERIDTDGSQVRLKNLQVWRGLSSLEDSNAGTRLMVGTEKRKAVETASLPNVDTSTSDPIHSTVEVGEGTNIGTDPDVAQQIANEQQNIQQLEAMLATAPESRRGLLDQLLADARANLATLQQPAPAPVVEEVPAATTPVEQQQPVEQPAPVEQAADPYNLRADPFVYHPPDGPAATLADATPAPNPAPVNEPAPAPVSEPVAAATTPTVEPVDEGANYEQRREAGAYRDATGNVYTRQDTTVPMVEGGTQDIEFAEGVMQPVRYAVIEADNFQPSHNNTGQRNPTHFLPEAQPKERGDEGSQRAQNTIAATPDLGRLATSPNAYSGAPVINRRGEVLQGNNRSIGVKRHYAEGGTSYRQDLLDQAESLGLDRAAIEGMRQPVLVRVADVSDQRAIELGNYDVKQMETGGTQRIDAVTTARRIPFSDKLAIVRRLLANPDDTVNANIRNNIKSVYPILSGYLNSAQLQTLFTKNGELKPQGLQDVEQLLRHFMFEGGDVSLPTIFEELPLHLREGLFKSLPSIYGVPQQASLLEQIQNAAVLIHATLRTGADNVRGYMGQGDMFDTAKDSKYAPVDIALAEQIFAAKTQKAVRDLFRNYQSLVEGRTDMFDTVPGMSKPQAIQQLLGVDYDSTINDTLNIENEAEQSISTNEPPAPAGNDAAASGPVAESTGPTENIGTDAPADQSATAATAAATTGDSGSGGTGTTETANEPGPVGPKKVNFARRSADIERATNELDDLFNDFMKGSGLSSGINPAQAAKAVRIVAKLAEIGYYRIEDMAKFLVEKGMNDILPFLKDAYRQFRANPVIETPDGPVAFSHELINSLDNENTIAAADIESVASRISDSGSSDSMGQRTTAAADRTAGRRTSPRPPIRVANAENIPTPSGQFVVEGTYDIDEHQRLGVNLAISRFSNGGQGFLLADGAGVGKTREILVAAETFRTQMLAPDEKVLLVSLSGPLADSYPSDARTLGIDLSNFEIGTYDDLRNGKIGKGQYGMVILDESHNIKNPLSGKAQAFAKVQARHTLFASATPMDKPEHAIYFMSQITDRTPEEVQRDLGINIAYVEWKGDMVPVAQLTVNYDTYLERLIDMRNGAISNGAMIRREYPFYGEVESKTYTMPPELAREADMINERHEDRIEKAEDIVQFIHTTIKRMPPLEGAALDRAVEKFVKDERRARIQNLQKISESHKALHIAWPEAMQALSEGKQVIITAENVETTDIEIGSPRSKSYYKKADIKSAFQLLTEKFAEAGIPVAQLYGGNNAQRTRYKAEQDKFQSGQARVMLMTAKSGGTGINLDDVEGDAPRLLIKLTPNYSGDVFEQVLGRVSRRNTQTPARVLIPYYNNNQSDLSRRNRVTEKVNIIKGIVSGDADIDRDRIAADQREALEGQTNEDGTPRPATVVQPKKQGLEFVTQGKGFFVKGDTFPINKLLGKEGLGGRWVGAQKGWLFPLTRLTEVQTAAMAAYNSHLQSDQNTMKNMLIEYSDQDVVDSLQYGDLDDQLDILRAAYSDVSRAKRIENKLKSRVANSAVGLVRRLLAPSDTLTAKARAFDAIRAYRKQRAEIKALRGKERGSAWLQEKLMRANRYGDISDASARLATELIRSNPALFEDLAISITENKNPESGVQGWYDAGQRLVKIFSGSTDLTAVHELLHHTERFLPQAVRENIINEWNARVEDKRKQVLRDLASTTDENERYRLTTALAYLGLAQEAMVESSYGKVQQMRTTMEKYLPMIGRDYYQLFNPSEFWAVNAAQIFQRWDGQPKTRSFSEAVRNWYNALVNSVRNVFGLNKTRAVESGLRAILRGETLPAMQGAQLSAQNLLFSTNGPANQNPNINPNTANNGPTPTGTTGSGTGGSTGGTTPPTPPGGTAGGAAAGGQQGGAPYQVNLRTRTNQAAFWDKTKSNWKEWMRPGGNVDKIFSSLKFKENANLNRWKAEARHVQGNFQRAMYEAFGTNQLRDRKNVQLLKDRGYTVDEAATRLTLPDGTVIQDQDIMDFHNAVPNGLDAIVDMKERVAAIQFLNNTTLIDQALKGDARAMQMLPHKVQTAVGQMRDFIDQMTERLKQSGRLPQVAVEQQALAQYLAAAGQNPDQRVLDYYQMRISFAQKIDNNLGRYVNRAYLKHRVENWRSKVRQEVVDNAVNYLFNEAAAQGQTLTQQEAHDLIEALVSSDSVDTIINQTQFGLNTGILKALKDIPPEIRDLFGEVKEAEWNFMNTAMQMAQLLERDRFLNDTLNAGLGTIFENDPYTARQRGFEKIDKPMWGPLHGKFAAPEMIRAMKDWDTGDLSDVKAWRYIQQMNTYTKVAKTSLSWVSELGNLFGNMTMLTMNANMKPKEFRNGFMAFKDVFNANTDAQNQAFIERLSGLGVIGTSLPAYEMRGRVNDITQGLDQLSDTDFMGWGTKLWNNVRRVKDKAGEVYGATDDIFKIITFQSERDALRRAYDNSGVPKTDAELDREAADLVNRIMPNYAMVPKAIRKMSRNLPVIGTFVSYPTELMRVTYNSIALSMEQLRNANPGIRMLGAKRLLSQIATISMPYMAKFGVGMALAAAGMKPDDDEEEAVMDLLPEWYKNQDVIVYKKDGAFYAYQLASIDGHTNLREIVNAAIRADSAPQGAWEAFKELAAPYLGPSMLANKAIQHIRNRDQYDRPIYNEKDSFDEKAAKITEHYGEAGLPQTWVDFYIKPGKYMEKYMADPVANQGDLEKYRLAMLKFATGQRVLRITAKDAEWRMKDIKDEAAQYRKKGQNDLKEDPDKVNDVVENYVENIKELQEQMARYQQIHKILSQ